MLFAWGMNNFGQLGTGDNENKMIPTIVKGLEDIKIISFDCGEYHNIALSGNSFMPFTTNPYLFVFCFSMSFIFLYFSIFGQLTRECLHGETTKKDNLETTPQTTATFHWKWRN
jgi:hypothetical protein